MICRGKHRVCELSTILMQTVFIIHNIWSLIITYVTSCAHIGLDHVHSRTFFDYHVRSNDQSPYYHVRCWLSSINQIALREWNWLRKYLTALANFTVVKKWYPCNDCYVTCMFCNMNRFGGTLSPLHQILTPVHDKTEVGMLLYVLTQLWGQINPSGFQSPLLVKYDIVFMWIKYFEFEFEFEVRSNDKRTILSCSLLTIMYSHEYHVLTNQKHLYCHARCWLLCTQKYSFKCVRIDKIYILLTIMVVS